MSFNADLQILTQPGGTGNVTYSLAASFDPKAVILWATPLAADGTAASYALGVGFGTYRGSTVQQRYVSLRGLDAAASADTARGQGSDALLVLQTNSAGASSRDLEIDLISMQTGATSEVVLAWQNLHTTASIRVFMLVLGGSDITDALVDSYNATGGSTTDETVVASFGKPELLFFACSGTTNTDTAATALFSFGFGKQGEAGRGFGFTQTDGNTASLTGMAQRSDKIMPFVTAPTTAVNSNLDTTVANWPTDGFRTIQDGLSAVIPIVSYLALRTTAQITTGSNTALTAGSTQDNDAGFVPKLGLVFGWNHTATSTQQDAQADQVGFGIGAYDGTTVGWAGFTEDDGAGTMISKSHQVDDKIIRNYTAPTPTLVSEASAAFSGNNLQLNWTDLDTVAREYQWLVMGDAAAAAPETIASLVTPRWRT